MNKLILLAPFLLLMLMGIAGATTPSTIPSGIQYYVPINLTNSQTTATSAPFQQMVNITESTYSSYIAYSGSTANFEYFYSNGTIIPAWIESNSSGKLITWVKTISIPASSHIQIYLGFASKTTNLLSSSGTSGIGEAPQLSSTYAKYDDGASVFPNYWNFAGTTLPSPFTSVIGTDGSVSVNNGLSITLSSGAWGTYVISNSTFTLTNQVLEADMQQNPLPSGTSQTVDVSLIWTGSSSGSTSSYAFTLSGSSPPVFETVCDYEQGGATFTTNWGCTFGTTYTENTNYNIAGLGITSAGDIGFTQFNYAQNNTGSSAQAITSGYIMLQTTQQTANYQWLRTRAYPPNGVMPSVTFGAVQSIYTTLSISPNPATYGQSITITATCNSTDTCAYILQRCGSVNPVYAERKRCI